MVADSRSQQFRHFCDLDNVLKSFRAVAAGDDPEVSVVGPGRVGSRDVVRLEASDDGKKIVAWVATTAPHDVLRMDARGEGTSGTLSFSQFDVPVDAQAPAPSEVVNPSGEQQG